MRAFALLALLLSFSAAYGEIRVHDDAGREVRLPAPARRIVSLAPHISETLFAAGAGERLVGVVDYSDYPPAAKKLPRIGSYERVDLERLLALKPDLVVAWQSGTPAALVDKLRQLGLPVYLSQPDRLDDIASDLERFGRLAGTTPVAAAAAARFRTRLAGLRSTNAGQPPLRVFYQVWHQPLMTVAGRQIIGDVIRLCGGENIFGSLSALAPAVGIEAVLAAQPEVIVAAGMGDARPDWLDDWKKWPRLPAVAQGNLFHLHPDLMHRHTPRLLDGAELMCGFFAQARQRRSRP